MTNSMQASKLPSFSKCDGQPVIVIFFSFMPVNGRNFLLSIHFDFAITIWCSNRPETYKIFQKVTFEIQFNLGGEKERLCLTMKSIQQIEHLV